MSLLQLLEASADNNEKAQQDDSGIFSGSRAERENVTTKRSLVILLEDCYEDKMASEIQPKRLFRTGRVTRSSTKATKKKNSYQFRSVSR